MGDVERLMLPGWARSGHETRPVPPVAADPPPRRVETPEERAQRLTAPRAAWDAEWGRRCPPMYADARLDGLAVDQHPDALRRWLDNGHRTLVLHGRSGCGKTFSAYAVARAALDGGRWATAWQASEVLRALRPGEGHDTEAWRTLTRADLLVLDDLGREQTTEWSRDQVTALLAERAQWQRRLVVTTNLSGPDVAARYGAPVLDRLLDDAVVLAFEGPSRRRRAAW